MKFVFVPKLISTDFSPLNFLYETTIQGELSSVHGNEYGKIELKILKEDTPDELLKKLFNGEHPSVTIDFD